MAPSAQYIVPVGCSMEADYIIYTLINVWTSIMYNKLIKNIFYRQLFLWQKSYTVNVFPVVYSWILPRSNRLNSKTLFFKYILKVQLIFFLTVHVTYSHSVALKFFAKIPSSRGMAEFWINFFNRCVEKFCAPRMLISNFFSYFIHLFYVSSK